MSCLSFISNQEYTIPISNPLLPQTKTICQLKANLPLLHKQSFKPSCTPNSQYYPVGLSVMVLKKAIFTALSNRQFSWSEVPLLHTM